MKMNNVLSELIYEYYESRILFGIYRYGEQLMSVPRICASFGFGRNTVQSALDKLEKKGYIVTEERKAARIVYQGTEELFKKNAAEYFTPRKEGILDFYFGGNLLFLPIWKIGIFRLQKDPMSHRFWNQNMPGKATVPVPVLLYFDILNSFHNELLINLYWQCLRYLNFVYSISNREKPDNGTVKMFSSNDINSLKREFDSYFNKLRNEVMDFIESARGKYDMEPVCQIPFTWTIYRRRPQVRYTLASVIIREILWEHYPVGSYLPSLPQMAETYHVSISTVRRTLTVLHSLGVTRTYTGIGTQVCLEPVDSDILNVSEIHENLRLHGEAMQILALTVREVTLVTLKAASDRKREELLHTIAQLRGKTSSILCIDVLLSFISSECPSAFIRECYDKLRELAAWGYIFSAVLMSAGQLDCDFGDFIGRLEKNLRDGNLAGFADEWHYFVESRMNFFYTEFPLKDL